MASAGAQCDHVNHVETQLPYATLVAAVWAIGYLMAGFMRTPWIPIIIEAIILIGVIMILGKQNWNEN